MLQNHTCQNPTICDAKTLHALPKFSSNTQRFQVENGQYVSVLFVIPVIIDIQGRRFEIFYFGIQNS